MNFNNSKLTHFLSFVCVFESKVPRHACLEATKKKNKVTESYNRNRGKQNGAIVTIFSLITIILVSKSRKSLGFYVWESFKAFVISRMFSSSRWLL